MRSTSIALLAAAAGAAVAENSTDCSEGLHMIVARGTNEDAGPGSMGELADRVADRIKSSDVEGLDYPASLTDPDYVDSVSEGTSELRETIREYVKACPDSKLAVLGYSQVGIFRNWSYEAGSLTVVQGAQVSSDVFCGGDSSGSDDNEALSKDLVEESSMFYKSRMAEIPD